MKNGYDQFFKQARKSSGESVPVRRSKTMGSSESKKSVKKKQSFPFKLVTVIFISAVSVGYSFLYLEEIENFISRVELQVFETSLAEGAAPAAAPKDAVAPSTKTVAAESSSVKSAETVSLQDEDQLKVLVQRKKQLDDREAELSRTEAELEEQKMVLEKRMAELEETRRKISSVLEDRVKVDDQKIDTLVQVYTNMKAPQAAKIFETLDEDLAIEILGRMKKKNAADIMNLIKPEKAQVFSEKFAGFKTK